MNNHKDCGSCIDNQKKYHIFNSFYLTDRSTIYTGADIYHAIHMKQVRDKKCWIGCKKQRLIPSEEKAP